jgi:hypothetical protein
MCSAGLGARPSADHVPDAHLFLSGLRLRRGLVRLGHVGLVMADGAPGCGAEFAVTGQVPGDPAGNGSLDASLGFRGTAGGERNSGNASERNNPSHE